MKTKNYIKMCEQAEEIQKLWKPKIGDYYYEKGHHKICDKKPYHYIAILDKEKLYLFYKKHNDNLVEYKRFLLPTLEQLWDMLEGTVMANLTITVYETLQEHLLNHVMEHNWGKMWNNEKWEEI